MQKDVSVEKISAESAQLSRRPSRLPRSLSGNGTGRSVWEAAVTRRSLDVLADIYLTTPDNRKYSSGFVSGDKVTRLLAADAYFRFIASQIR